MKERIILTGSKQRQHAIDLLNKLGPGDGQHEVTIKPYKKNRSLAQNNLLWMWVGIIRDHIRDSAGEIYSNEDVHEALKQRFLEPKVVSLPDGPVYIKTPSRTLTVGQFAEYLEHVEAYAADCLNLQLPRPEDLYMEALGTK